ncbi:hypothetical protein TNCV_2149131 [Trichonephila clavipes]|nr:hypothetical protein TNCV_2149131 [Trichonephila clavipes]
METKRKLDLTGASEMNRLYPNSRRESGNENRYLNTLPRRGMEEEAARRKREKYVTRAGMEERKEGGLTAPKRVRGAPKTQSEWRSCGFFFFFFFCSWMNKRMETARQNLQPEQSWN